MLRARLAAIGTQAGLHSSPPFSLQRLNDDACTCVAGKQHLGGNI